MSADVNEVCRLLDAKGIEHHETDTGHEVYWDAGDVRWSYWGRIYGGRGPRLTAHGIGPRQAVAAAEAGTDEGMPIWQYVSRTAQGIVEDVYFLLEGCDGAELEAYDQVRELAGKMRCVAEDMRRKGYR